MYVQVVGRHRHRQVLKPREMQGLSRYQLQPASLHGHDAEKTTRFVKLTRYFIATNRVAKSCALIQLESFVCVCVCVCVHESLPKSSHAESITKYTLIFVVFHCKSLLKQSLPSLWNGSSLCATVGSTAGTDFFEPRVTRLVIVHKFPAHPGNDDLVHVISFLDTRRNHKRRSQASTEGGVKKGILLVGKNCCTDRPVCSDALLHWQTVRRSIAQAHYYTDRPCAGALLHCQTVRRSIAALTDRAQAHFCTDRLCAGALLDW